MVQPYIVFELGAKSATIIYQITTTSVEDIAHRLEGSKMYVHRLPSILVADDLGYTLLRRKLHLEQQKKRLDLEALVLWWTYVCEAVEEEYTPVEE
jgi:hypothetical protein